MSRGGRTTSVSLSGASGKVFQYQHMAYRLKDFRFSVEALRAEEVPWGSCAQKDPNVRSPSLLSDGFSEDYSGPVLDLHMSHNLNSLKGNYILDHTGEYYGGY